METKKLTKEEALAHFLAGREKKRQCIERLEKKMKADYEQRTGRKATSFFAM